MKTGVVFDIDNNKAVLMLAGGSFVSVSAKAHWKKGDVVSVKQHVFSAKMLYTIAACFALITFFGTGGFKLYFTQISLISVDINPSIEIGLNRFDRVINVSSYNGYDNTADLFHKKYNDAIETLISSEAIAPYIATKDTWILFSVQSAVPKKSAALGDAMITETQSLVERQIADKSDCHIVSGEFANEAHGYGLTPRKYLEILKLKELVFEINIDDYKFMSIKEISKIIEQFYVSDNEHEHEHNNLTVDEPEWPSDYALPVSHVEPVSSVSDSENNDSNNNDSQNSDNQNKDSNNNDSDNNDSNNSDSKNNHSKNNDSDNTYLPETPQPSSLPQNSNASKNIAHLEETQPKKSDISEQSVKDNGNDHKVIEEKRSDNTKQRQPEISVPKSSTPLVTTPSSIYNQKDSDSSQGRPGNIPPKAGTNTAPGTEGPTTPDQPNPPENGNENGNMKQGSVGNPDPPKTGGNENGNDDDGYNGNDGDNNGDNDTDNGDGGTDNSDNCDDNGDDDTDNSDNDTDNGDGGTDNSDYCDDNGDDDTDNSDDCDDNGDDDTDNDDDGTDNDDDGTDNGDDGSKSDTNCEMLYVCD